MTQIKHLERSLDFSIRKRSYDNASFMSYTFIRTQRLVLQLLRKRDRTKEKAASTKQNLSTSHCLSIQYELWSHIRE